MLSLRASNYNPESPFTPECIKNARQRKLAGRKESLNNLNDQFKRKVMRALVMS